MEFPLTHHYQGSLMDQIESSCSFRNVFKRDSFFSGHRFRKRNNPCGGKITCSKRPLETRLKPRPLRINTDVVKEESNQMKKHSESMCSRIEKLVLCNRYREALETFEVLEQTGSGFDMNSSTYVALMDACTGLKSVKGVKRVYNYMISNGYIMDQYISNRVLIMHVKCGLMKDARRLFDEMPERSLISWNTMISGLVDSKNYYEAFQLFLIMWEEYSDCNSRSFAAMIRASSGLSRIDAGKQFHSCVVKTGLRDNIFISCGLIDMYSKCGSIEDAQFVFDEMPEKTTVGWNSIISGYALLGYTEEALEMYHVMRDSGVGLDHFTYSIMVRICARLASLDHAKQAHAGLVRHGFGSDIVANTSLVDFYGKWGRVDDARRVFDNMPCRNVMTWNAMISGYGNQGRGLDAVELFDQMVNERTTKPNHVTFLAVLSACSYSGLFHRGWELFRNMRRVHKINPRPMHYVCMVESLGRERRLHDAFAFINAAPFDPTANMWAALLTAARVDTNIELGKLAAEKLYELEPEKVSNYVVLLNVYKKSNLAASVLHTLRRKGLTINPPCSWIEIKKQPYVFHSEHKHHLQTNEIYDKLDSLILKISQHGYVLLDNKTLLPDVDERENDMDTVPYHSEKLAVAFGLIHTSEWTPLQVVQSHRVCNDCHTAIKLIGLVTGRDIVLRDSGRFHHFRDGSCSCGDYW